MSRLQSTLTSAVPKRRGVRLLSQEQQQEIKQAFSLFDPNQTNHISYHELKVILRALGFDPKKSELTQLAKCYDVTQSGRLSFQDYCEIMEKKYSERDPIEQTLKAFKLFDEEGKGKISAHDLKRISRELGESLKQEEIFAMIDEFDLDGDGYINEEEFLSIIRPSIA